MKTENSNSQEKTTGQSQHSHSKHMWMMVICCGLPILGFMAVGALGINAPSFETLIFLICPIGMVLMMFSMRKQHGDQKEGHSCCHSKDEHQEKTLNGICYDEQ